MAYLLCFKLSACPSIHLYKYFKINQRMYLKATLIFIVALTCCGIWADAQPASFAPRGIGGGGALFFPKINPANDNEFYISCDMSQLFHSTDFGDSYTQLHFSKLAVLNVSTYEFTSNSNVAYCNYNDGNEGYPVKTNDGGNTWTALPGFDANQGGVYRMAANYNKPNQLLMNYYGQIVISQDSGATFTLVKQATNNGAGIIMGGVFYTGDSIYIGTNEGILYSTNGGTSFSTMITTGIPGSDAIWSFAGAANGGTMRFVCITGANNNTYNGIMPWDYYGYATGVYTMDNANGAWVAASTGINFSNDFVMYTAMAEHDVNTMYLAGGSHIGNEVILKSSNGGNSWSHIFNTINNQNIITGWQGYNGDKQWSWGETAFGIAVAPNNPNKVLFGDFGFVHVSSDGGANWKQAYVSNSDEHAAAAPTPQYGFYHSIGLENTTCWQVDWESPQDMFACYSDIAGIRSNDSGKSWGYPLGGVAANSVYRIAKTPDGTMYAGASNVHDMYQSTRLKDAQLDAFDATGKIIFSHNHGAQWQPLHQFNHPVFWLAIDPNDTNTMYASVIHHDTSIGGVYVTHNLSDSGLATWTKLPAPPRTEGHPASIIVLNDGKVLCTFSGRINGNSFTASSGVFLYDPASGTWADRSDPNMQYWTKDIVLDPSDPNQDSWYACVFSAWGNANGPKGGLYKTTNRGTTWTKLTGNQFDRVTSITFDPQYDSVAYLTTETQGLNYSSNMNSANPTFSLVDSYPFRQPERVFFNPYDNSEIWVSSFGNGMKMGKLSAVAGVPVFAKSSGMIKAWPNPAGHILHVDLQGIALKTGLVQVYNATGQEIRRINTKQKQVDIDTRNWPAGIYLVSCEGYLAKVIKE
ncbi:MAG: hypothetical protein BGO69_16370 [Bacteroidetes bacterium 46-16]|nr:MAG: hypothetical protein BGO69_16370 [Bacteroidetes bacterium 46-16]